MKFNIIITCRDREKYLNKNLFYINLANSNKTHDIQVYIISNKIYFSSKFENIKIMHKRIKNNDKLFNKSKYINLGMKKMRQDYDYFIQWDVDLIINPELFNDIEKVNIDWIVLSGEKLTKESTEYFFKTLLKWDNIKILGKDNMSIQQNKMNRFVGNIAIKKETLQKYMEILKQETLYNENFTGWGGEDSLLSITSTKMVTYKIIKKVFIYNAWNHLWHEREPDKLTFDKKQQQKNVEFLNNQLIHNETKIRNFKTQK